MIIEIKFLYLAMLAQLAVPICVLLLNAKRKGAERKKGNIQDSAAINNQAWALPVLLTSNSLANQFQLPVIFYVLCLMFLQIGHTSGFLVGLAWWFVLTRWVHAYVHVTSNYIPARFGVFLAGAVALLIMFLYAIWVFISL